MHPSRCYLICTTPRSGSSLLCDILRGTQLAGQPNEYFYDGAYPFFFEQFKVSTFSNYFPKILAATTTQNGVFGAKFMTYYFFDFVDRVRQLPAYQNRTLTTAELLGDLFPNLKYLWLTRRNKVRQAVSYARASQSNVWHHYDEQPAEVANVKLTRKHINDTMQAITLQEAIWQEYFSEAGIVPLTLVYEDFCEFPEKTMKRIFDFLGIPIPADLTLDTIRQGKKLADSASDQFTQSYYQHYKSSWHNWDRSVGSAKPGGWQRIVNIIQRKITARIR